MPPSDSSRWNDRYRQDRYTASPPPPGLLINHAHLLPSQGLALDAAMGLGGGAGFLLARGIQVLGVDISEVAVCQAKARLPELWAVVADLSHFYLPTAAFDVICNFYFLDRSLWPHYRRALKPGGLLLVETLTQAMLAQKPDIDAQYLLASGELRQAFADWPVLFYEEKWTMAERGFPHTVASLVARKPT